MPEISRAFASNRILSKLSAADCRKMAAHLAPIDLPLGQVLCEPGARPQFAYFPLSCMISLVMITNGRPRVEVGLVGREGMAGIGIALGVAESPTQTVVQGKGVAIRIPAAMFAQALARNTELRAEAHRFAHASLVMAMVCAACNIEHALEARLARWLLMTRDRLSTTTFSITQEFLGQMLGVRRAAVNVVASELQSRGLINYRRGVLKLLDTAGLRRTACSCYSKIKKLSAGPDETM